jgi:hypothetical protein
MNSRIYYVAFLAGSHDLKVTSIIGARQQRSKTQRV